MTPSVGLPVRSLLTAGVTASLVGAAVVVPIATDWHPRLVSPAVQLSAAIAPLLQPIAVDAQIVAAATSPGGFVKEAYNAIEPWVAYGFELADYALSWVPGLWWIAPGIDLAYFSIEPLVQAGVYVFADVLDLDFAQIGPDVQAGIQESVTNFVDYGLAWIGSLVPLPPIPPIPPRPGAAVTTNPAAAASATPKRTGAAAAVSPETVDADLVVAAEPATAVVVPDNPGVTAVETPRPRRQHSRAATPPPPAAAQVAPDRAEAPAADTGTARKATRANRAARGV